MRSLTAPATGKQSAGPDVRRRAVGVTGTDRPFCPLPLRHDSADLGAFDEAVEDHHQGFGGRIPNPLRLTAQTLTYSFESMGRPNKLTDNQATPVDWAKDVVYNVAGQMTQMKYTSEMSGSLYYTETRSYNALGQLTQLTAYNVNRTYSFPSTANDGRITQMADAVSGETVQYQYDSLKRLISASTTGPQWGQSFSYDGFGNLLSQTVTKGSAPTLSVNVSGSTNRITTSGYSYDSNGNLTAMPFVTMSYDVENRMVEAVHSLNGTDRYVYDPANRRVWKQGPGPTYTYFYGVDGALLGSYTGGGYGYFSGDPWGVNVYFAGKQIWAEASSVAPDRLGSMVKHFPYGEEPTTTGQNRVKFATYYRDQTTALDYARNRYYSSTLARFTTPDPYRASGGAADPQSWNRYAYVQNDPVNFLDPAGLAKCPPGSEATCIDVVASALDVDPLASAFRGLLSMRFVVPFNLERLPEDAYPPEEPEPAPPPCPPVPAHPSNASLASNAAAAVSMRSVTRIMFAFMPPPNRADLGDLVFVAWFANQVRPGGNWDYKKGGQTEYLDFGNFNYGFVGRAAGFSEDVLLRAGGFVQNLTDFMTVLRGKPPVGTGNPLGGPPYGDDSADQVQIREGIRAYEGWSRKECDY